MDKIPEFRPLPFKTAQEVVDAFKAGKKLRLVEPRGVFDVTGAYVSSRGFVVAEFNVDRYMDHWVFNADGSLAAGGPERHLILTEAPQEEKPAGLAPLIRKQQAAKRESADASGITEGDRANLKPADDLSYFAAGLAPVEPKRSAAGLLTVWNPDQRRVA